MVFDEEVSQGRGPRCGLVRRVLSMCRCVMALCKVPSCKCPRRRSAVYRARDAVTKMCNGPSHQRRLLYTPREPLTGTAGSCQAMRLLLRRPPNPTTISGAAGGKLMAPHALTRATPNPHHP